MHLINIINMNPPGNFHTILQMVHVHVWVSLKEYMQFPDKIDACVAPQWLFFRVLSRISCTLPYSQASHTQLMKSMHGTASLRVME